MLAGTTVVSKKLAQMLIVNIVINDIAFFLLFTRNFITSISEETVSILNSVTLIYVNNLTSKHRMDSFCYRTRFLGRLYTLFDFSLNLLWKQNFRLRGYRAKMWEFRLNSDKVIMVLANELRKNKAIFGPKMTSYLINMFCLHVDWIY